MFHELGIKVRKRFVTFKSWQYSALALLLEVTVLAICLMLVLLNLEIFALSAFMVYSFWAFFFIEKTFYNRPTSQDSMVVLIMGIVYGIAFPVYVNYHLRKNDSKGS
jgi:hypothetical protein